MITKIFLDSADPRETQIAINLLGFIDGQTTNPSLLAKSPQAVEYKNQHGHFSLAALLGLYRETVQEISKLIPRGSVSIEVPATTINTAIDLLDIAREMFAWIPNAHIKFPITKAGLAAASLAIHEGMRVNMTLCFSQEQAAAVYQATASTGAETLPGYKNIFISPFIGRLDDIGQKGLDLIVNIQRMYASSDRHVALLAASIRNLDHLRALLAWNVDMATVPLNVLEEWVAANKPTTQGGLITKLKPLVYQNIDLKNSDTAYDINHQLTVVGVEKFTADWNGLL